MIRPNLILVTVDSLRYDALGCSGIRSIGTPHIDALALESVVLDQAVANGPRTQASFPSMLCSLYPLVAGERDGLPEEAGSLAQRLRQAGYATAAFNPSNPFLTRESGYDRGFDLFVDFWDVHPRHRTDEPRRSLRGFARRVHDGIGRRNLGFLMLVQALLQREGGQYLTGTVIVERALEWIRRQDGPFFVWLHFMDIHFPYHPLPGQRGWRDRWAYLLGMAGMATGAPNRANRELRRLYDRRVELMDGVVGRLMRGLGRLDHGDETVVVLTSDHGEQFGEHGGYAHGPVLYDELLRVPLLIRAPARLGHRRIEGQFGLIDLSPTLLELVEVEPPPSFEGRGRLALLNGGSPKLDTTVFAEAAHSGRQRSRVGVPDIHRIVACRTRSWKYIRDEEGQREELYDLVRDPHETHDTAGRCADVLDDLRRRVDGHLRFVEAESQRFGTPRARRAACGDDEVRRRLAELGYL